MISLSTHITLLARFNDAWHNSFMAQIFHVVFRSLRFTLVFSALLPFSSD